MDIYNQNTVCHRPDFRCCFPRYLIPKLTI